MTKLWKERTCGGQGLGGDGDRKEAYVTVKGTVGEPRGNDLFLDCIDVSILVVIL